MSTSTKIRIQLFYTILVSFFFISSCKDKSSQGTFTSAVRPAQALSTFESPTGCKSELVAAEPLISDPVDMEIDEYGNMYVGEMHGYPLDKSGSGNIILLKDTNSDGEM